MNGNFRLSGFMKKTYEAAQTKTAIITNETWATTILRGFVVAHAFCFMLIDISTEDKDGDTGQHGGD